MDLQNVIVIVIVALVAMFLLPKLGMRGRAGGSSPLNPSGRNPLNPPGTVNPTTPRTTERRDTDRKDGDFVGDIEADQGPSERKKSL